MRWPRTPPPPPFYHGTAKEFGLTKHGTRRGEIGAEGTTGNAITPSPNRSATATKGTTAEGNLFQPLEEPESESESECVSTFESQCEAESESECESESGDKWEWIW